jgi:hypothetical protein
MQNRTRAAIVATAIVGVAAVGGGVALAAGGGDDDATDTPITGQELDRASAAALEHTGEGRVTETEKGDEESLYEIAGRRPAGRGLQGRERRAGRGVPERRRLTRRTGGRRSSARVRRPACP